MTEEDPFETKKYQKGPRGDSYADTCRYTCGCGCRTCRVTWRRTQLVSVMPKNVKL